MTEPAPKGWAAPWLAVLFLVGCSHAERPVAPSRLATVAPSESAGAPSPAPAATPSPTPSAAPAQDVPVPEPSPDCIHDSDHEVASVSLAVYFLECGGERVPGSKDIKQVPVGCRVHLNATPRDGMGAPTCSHSWPEWQIGPPDLASNLLGQSFTPAFTAEAEGQFWVRCIVDGVRSDYLYLTFVQP